MISISIPALRKLLTVFNLSTVFSSKYVTLNPTQHVSMTLGALTLSGAGFTIHLRE